MKWKKRKRAQELRVDEFSVQQLRESHDTIQKLTSEIQELQERVNCMIDSREFQDIESNYSGNFSHVPSQPAVVPSPRSRAVIDSSQTPYQGTLHSTTPSPTGSIPVQVSAGRPVARGEERIGSTTPMPMSARRPSTMNSFLPRKSHIILWLDSKDHRYRSFSSINSSPLHHFRDGKFDSKPR